MEMSFGTASSWSTALWTLISAPVLQLDFGVEVRPLIEFAYEHRRSTPIFDALKTVMDPRKVERLILGLRILSQPLLACHNLLKIAKAVPSLQKIQFHAIASPAALQLTTRNKISLEEAWQELSMPAADAKRRSWLAKHEKNFRKDCGGPLRLVHAEIQLVNFYRKQPGATLEKLHRYIGCNKKACFMCQLFLNSCDLKLSNQGCHGAIPRIPCTLPCDMASDAQKVLQNMTVKMKKLILEEVNDRSIHVAPQKQSIIVSSVHEGQGNNPELLRATKETYNGILQDGLKEIHKK